MELDFIFTLVALGFIVVFTVTIILYYLLVQKPETQRETRVNRKLILAFIQNIQRIEIEKMAKKLDLEEFTVRDILLDLAREQNLPGMLVFPNLYLDYQYCLTLINELLETQSSNEIPLKFFADKFSTTVHNTNKILLELLMNQKIQGSLDSTRKIFIASKVKIDRLEPSCPFCNATITLMASECTNCGAQLKKCGVCNLTIGTEGYSTCPFCGQSAHTSHLLEWLKVKGKCPLCKHDLHEYDL